MGRESLNRMDLDTRWPYHHRIRELQRSHPQEWPVYWCAYLAVLGESWATGSRVPLTTAWVPSLPCSLTDAGEALMAVGLLDKALRVPAHSWKEWYEPAAERISRMSARGKAGASARWSKHEKRTVAQSNGDAQALLADAPRQPSTPAIHASHATPSKPSIHVSRSEKRDQPASQNPENGSIDRSNGTTLPAPEDEQIIARDRAILADPASPEWKREAAIANLHNLGVHQP